MESSLWNQGYRPLQRFRHTRGGRVTSLTMQHQVPSEILRDALDHLNQGVVLLDQELRIEFMNRLMRTFSLFGEEPDYEGVPYEQLLRTAYARGRYNRS